METALKFIFHNFLVHYKIYVSIENFTYKNDKAHVKIKCTDINKNTGGICLMNLENYQIRLKGEIHAR
jgi:hypothetical protein